MQRRLCKARVLQRLAKQHEQHAGDRAGAVAQLLANVGLCCRLVHHHRLRKLRPEAVCHAKLVLGCQMLAGGSAEQVFGVGCQFPIDYKCQGDQALGCAMGAGNKSPQAGRFGSQGFGHVAHQVHKESRSCRRRHRSGHFEHRRLHALLLLARTKALHAKGQVLGQLT